MNVNKDRYKIKIICRTRPFLEKENKDCTVITNQKEKSVSIINQRNTNEILKYKFFKNKINYQ